MAKYTYVVRDVSGKTFRGSAETDTEERLIHALQNKGYIVLDVREGTAGSLFASGRSKKYYGGKVKGHVLAFFAEQLSTLIAGGVPLVRAVQLLGEYSSSPRLGFVLRQVA